MFSVGILYSAQQFIKLVKETPAINLDFPKFFTTFNVASPSVVLEVSQQCEWVILNLQGNLELTLKGEQVLGAGSEELALRIQLGHLLETYLPKWLPLLSYGRAEALKYMRPDLRQCFDEAGLSEENTNEVINWWDTYSKLSRKEKKEGNIEIGRRGEKLTINFETERTKRKPFWQSVESNFSGYDILSILNEHNPEPLMIEVKTANSRAESAVFFITKNEWTVAITSKNYIFHLWALQPKPKLLRVTVPDVEKHVPKNCGEGEWENVKIPFRSFF